MNGVGKISEAVAAAMASGMGHVPFARWLGLRVSSVDGDRVAMHFEMREEFVGNSEKSILHGGVIAAALDTVGGFAAWIGALTRAAENADEISPWLGTIDLRTDFLRPGTGAEFTASAFPLRVGSRLVVTRMELHNEFGDLIAVGTGTYVVPDRS